MAEGGIGQINIYQIRPDTGVLCPPRVPSRYPLFQFVAMLLISHLLHTNSSTQYAMHDSFWRFCLSSLSRPSSSAGRPLSRVGLMENRTGDFTREGRLFEMHRSAMATVGSEVFCSQGTRFRASSRLKPPSRIPTEPRFVRRRLHQGNREPIGAAPRGSTYTRWR